MLMHDPSQPDAAPSQLVRGRQAVLRRYEEALQWIVQRPTPTADPIRNSLRGFAAAVLGVLMVTLCIGLISAHIHVENIALLYLLAVITLAVTYGRGPSTLASILAFLAYDFFFIPPQHTFTVDDPTEWVSLGAL